MELVLEREYFSSGTNGILFYNGDEICKTIELPWLENQRRISCIPEGTYVIKKRYSPKFKWHLEVVAVERIEWLYCSGHDTDRRRKRHPITGCL